MVGALITVCVAIGLVLARGPIEINGLKPAIIERIEKQFPGFQSDIKGLELAWFHNDNALGLRIKGFELKDKQGRMVAKAKHLDAALAIEALMIAHLAPARVVANDFELIASISSQGRYELGYEAAGEPVPFTNIEEILAQISGPETLGKPLSFVRYLELGNGKLILIEKNGPLPLTGRVNELRYNKKNRKLSGTIDLSLDQFNARPAQIKGKLLGELGFSKFNLNLNFDGLNPKKTLPSIGAVAPARILDAPTSGNMVLSYVKGVGFKEAKAQFDADKGTLKFGQKPLAIEKAHIKAAYDSKTKIIGIEGLSIDYAMLSADLTGTVKINEPVRKLSIITEPLSFDFDLSAKTLKGRLAQDFAAQTITDALLKGRYIPSQSMLRIDSLTAQLGKTPLQSSVLLHVDEQNRVGAEVQARLKGQILKEEVFAFWPETLAPILRGTLINRVQNGVFSNAQFRMKAPPGHFSPEMIEDEDLKLTFDYDDTVVVIADKLPPVTKARGTGQLTGRAFKLSMETGQLGPLPLKNGGLEVADFRHPDAMLKIWSKSLTEASVALSTLDPITEGALGRAGLLDNRVRGRTEADVVITIPVKRQITPDQINITYEARVLQAQYDQVAMGWDLTKGDLLVRGDRHKNSLQITGKAQIGPFAGNFALSGAFSPQSPTLSFEGLFDAQDYGGSPIVKIPMRGDLQLGNSQGEGQIISEIYVGKVNWSGGNPLPNHDKRPTRVTLDGHLISQGLIKQGFPFFQEFNAQTPMRLDLLRSGDIWSGGIEAKDLSGNLAYIDGQDKRLVYQTQMTRQKAALFGLGTIPLFKTMRPLQVNLSLNNKEKQAIIKLDPFEAELGWTKGENGVVHRVLTSAIKPDQWALLGLPLNRFKPLDRLAISAFWSTDPISLEGRVMIGDQPIYFSRIDGAEPSSGFLVSGLINDNFLRTLGYAQDAMKIEGEIDWQWQINNKNDDQAPSQTLLMDATRAQIDYQWIGWAKPKDESLRLTVDTQGKKYQDGQQLSLGFDIRRLWVEGSRAAIDARASVGANNQLEFLDLERLWLDGVMDIKLGYHNPAGGADKTVSIRGNYLDLRPFLREFQPPKNRKEEAEIISQSLSKQNTPSHLVVDLAQLKLNDGDNLRNVSLNVKWDGANATVGAAQANLKSGELINLSLKDEADGTVFRLTTPNFGKTLGAVANLNNIKGGEASLIGFYRDYRFEAQLNAKNFYAQKISPLTQILSLASLQGLADTLSGEGIYFRELSLPMRYQQGLIYMPDGWAKGDSLGLSFVGTANMDLKTMDLQGHVIPAYMINSWFGDVSTNGIGLVGLSYNLRGPTKSPQTSVNPLSLILPGFLKKGWTPKSEDPIAPLISKKQNEAEPKLGQ